jgi:hypothetical protein
LSGAVRMAGVWHGFLGSRRKRTALGEWSKGTYPSGLKPGSALSVIFRSIAASESRGSFQNCVTGIFGMSGANERAARRIFELVLSAAAGWLSDHRDGHGGGGKLGNELVEHLFLPAFRNPALENLGDAAVLDLLPAGWR